jgi:hypothetical protein
MLFSSGVATNLDFVELLLKKKIADPNDQDHARMMDKNKQTPLMQCLL